MSIVKVLLILIAYGLVLFALAAWGFYNVNEELIKDNTNTPTNRKINVLVLYESLCSDSALFMKDQLGPNYDSLKNVIDITLVPFGKAHSTDGGAQVFCQHGPAECEGNRLQSCVLHQTADQETQVKFVVCQMLAQHKSSVQCCAESVGLSGDVDECMNSQLGTLLQLDAEKITQVYAPTFVPTIVYDGKFDQQLQESSLLDFKGVVCSLLQKRGSIAFNFVC